ncbi:serine palmitoyl CoA transferase subunit LcbA [Teratosphaeria nubilosa]|uniref:serine C-palmitoyltransferase n=1 Tax=Teratosphaeria nubilosa TaxID=161662 RepID=A0A6G1LB77_9PEZI|nr:serine palmitoyl CoA transferase subunit LcbA [Teratosphaeria nubilosa]
MDVAQATPATALPETIAAITDHSFWLAKQTLHTLRCIPGSAVVVRYVRASYQNDPFRSVLELLLLLVAVRYLVGSKYNPQQKATHIRLTEEEIDNLVEDWAPEPLVQEHADLARLNESVPVLHPDAPTGPRTKLRDGRTVTNLANFNHYNLANDHDLVEQAIQTIRRNGVGPCSAPGFAGTFDVHLQLEQDIASHFGTESTILYSQSFSTISSVISTFCKRGDIIVADRAVNFSIRLGMRASRSIVRWFEHNDMDSLDKVLAQLVKEDRPLTRRFIITEALSENVGDMVDLPKLLELKHKYKFRVLLDESRSYGILGETGRGLTEMQNVDVANIDIIVGSLAGCLSTGGGFCTGKKEMVEHQRLNSPAVTFSASLPTFLATTASAIIAKLQAGESEKDVKALRERIDAIRLQLEKSCWVCCTSAPSNPVIYLTLKDEHIYSRRFTRSEQEYLLQDCVDECLATYSILITRLKSMPIMDGLHPRDIFKEYQPPPSIKVCATTALSNKDMEKSGIAIRHAITAVMKRAKWQHGTVKSA